MTHLDRYPPSFHRAESDRREAAGVTATHRRTRRERQARLTGTPNGFPRVNCPLSDHTSTGVALQPRHSAPPAQYPTSRTMVAIQRVAIQRSCHRWYHTLVDKTTLYLPAELKLAIKRVARRRGVSEAEVIRDSIRAAVERQRPRPRGGLFAGREPIARDVDKQLKGFGER